MKYPALRFIAILSKVIAMLIFWGGIFGIYWFVHEDYLTYFQTAVTSVAVVLTSIVAYASGELIYVFLDIEENTSDLPLIRNLLSNTRTADNRQKVD